MEFENFVKRDTTDVAMKVRSAEKEESAKKSTSVQTETNTACTQTTTLVSNQFQNSKSGSCVSSKKKGTASRVDC